MRPSLVPWSKPQAPARVVVIGNQKGGSGKSTFAMHIVTALLKAGKRVASFDLDANQLTLTRYISNRRKWSCEHKVALELPDHYAVTDEPDDTPEWTNTVRTKRFISHLKTSKREHDYDFVVIDTPSGRQHLTLLREGVTDTLITPINDSLIDLDVFVAIEPSRREPQPSRYASTVLQLIRSRGGTRKHCATDWIVPRNRLEAIPSRNHRQVTKILTVLQSTLGLRSVRGLLDRPVYREFFAAGLTALDNVEGMDKSVSGDALLARQEVKDFIREIGFLEDHSNLDTAFDKALREIELAIAESTPKRRTGRS